MKEQLEYKLDDSNELPAIIEYKWTKKKKILIGVLIFLVILLLIMILILLVKAKDLKDEKDDFEEEIDYLKNDTTNLENKKIELINELEKKNIAYTVNNVPYADKNNSIKNSFKKGGAHYIEELGEINKGQDYEYTDLNVYDLIIPYTAQQNKDKYNKIILYIHGGSWTGGNRADAKAIYENLAQSGFISGTLDYTVLNITRYNNINIYRIVDEIFAAINHIKNFLKNEGFDEKKLELALFGASAGAHLSLLYSYCFKDSPIPVKFVVPLYAPVTLEYQYWYKIANLDEPLDSIDQKSIDLAKNQSKIENFDYSSLIWYINAWNGLHFFDNNSSMYDPDKNEIKTDNEIYKERIKKAKFGFPINYVEKDTIPTLCFYAGKDIDIGIGHYSLLKSYFDKKGNKNIELFYVKGASHNVADDPPEVGEILFSEFFSKISIYSDKYFSKD